MQHLNFPLIRKIIYLLMFFFFSTLTHASGQANIVFYDQPSYIDENAPFYAANGVKYTFAAKEFENKAILLVVWATWCGACLTEVAELDLLQKDFRKLPFIILPISEDYNVPQVIQEYYKQLKIEHLPIYYDVKNQLFQTLKISGLPTAFLINAEGQIVIKFVGNINWHDQQTRELLLPHIPGNPSLPKNSFQPKSLDYQSNSMEGDKVNPVPPK